MDKYRSIQRTIHPLDDFESLDRKINLVNEILCDKLIKNNENVFMEVYLRKVKRDLEIVKAFSPEEKIQFSTAYQEFLGYIASELKEGFYPEGFIVLQQFEANLLGKFGNFSFMHLFTEHYKLTVTVELNKNKDFTNAISKRYEAFEVSEWKSNPELSFFLALLCTNAENNEEYEKLVKYSNRYLEVLIKHYSEHEIKKIVPQSFLLSGYTKLNQFDKALEVYNKIEKSTFSSIARENSKVFFRMHDAAFDLFSHFDMKNEMIKSQELKVEAMSFFMKQENKEFFLQAVKLRDLYLHSNKLELARKIENRFTLPPVPKQKGESGR